MNKMQQRNIFLLRYSLELSNSGSCAKSALWWPCVVVCITQICVFYVQGQSVSGVTLSRTIFLLLKDETFSEECSKYLSSVPMSDIALQTWSVIDVKSKKNSGLFFALKLDIKPWGTPQDHGNLKVQFSTWKRGNYSQERKHIPLDFQHTSDGKNYYGCSADGSRFLAESTFMYLIICGGMREKLHLGPTWHAPLTVKHIISSDIIFFLWIWLASCFNPNHLELLFFAMKLER